MNNVTSLQFGSDGKKNTLEDIPDSIMAAFDAKAREMFPDEGDRAMSVAVAEYIDNMTREDEETLYLTGIPKGHMDRVKATLSNVGLTVYGFISRLLASATGGHFHVINYSNDGKLENAGHVIVFLGYPDDMMEAAKARASDEFDMGVEQAFASILLSFPYKEIENGG